MALKAHGDQMYGQHPYSVHLDEVADLCEPFGEDAQVIAYLHDVLEDTALPKEAITAAFGLFTTACVELVTDPPGPNRKARKEALYAKLKAIQVASPLALALVIKTADRLANVKAAIRDGNEKLIRMYTRENGRFFMACWRPGWVNSNMLTSACHLLGTWGI